MCTYVYIYIFVHIYVFYVEYINTARIQYIQGSHGAFCFTFILTLTRAYTFSSFRYLPFLFIAFNAMPDGESSDCARSFTRFILSCTVKEREAELRASERADERTSVRATGSRQIRRTRRPPFPHRTASSRARI